VPPHLPAGDPDLGARLDKPGRIVILKQAKAGVRVVKPLWCVLRSVLSSGHNRCFVCKAQLLGLAVESRGLGAINKGSNAKAADDSVPSVVGPCMLPMHCNS
jgi:hypothetical protein